MINIIMKRNSILHYYTISFIYRCIYSYIIIYKPLFGLLGVLSYCTTNLVEIDGNQQKSLQCNLPDVDQVYYSLNYSVSEFSSLMGLINTEGRKTISKISVSGNQLSSQSATADIQRPKGGTLSPQSTKTTFLLCCILI